MQNDEILNFMQNVVEYMFNYSSLSSYTNLNYTHIIACHSAFNSK
jgi:hypothetical protein